MRHSMRCVTWGERAYRFHRFALSRTAGTTEWWISCGLEFVGTMTCAAEVTTQEFDLHCQGWLAELLGPGRH